MKRKVGQRRRIKQAELKPKQLLRSPEALLCVTLSESVFDGTGQLKSKSPVSRNCQLFLPPTQEHPRSENMCPNKGQLRQQPQCKAQRTDSL